MKDPKVTEEEKEKVLPRKLVWTVDPLSGLLIAQNVDLESKPSRIRFKLAPATAKFFNRTRKSQLL